MWTLEELKKTVEKSYVPRRYRSLE